MRNDLEDRVRGLEKRMGAAAMTRAAELVVIALMAWAVLGVAGVDLARPIVMARTGFENWVTR